MEVRVAQTGEAFNLTLIDPKTGCEYTQDYIGNAGGFLNGDLYFNQEYNCYEGEKDAVEWWAKQISGQAAVNGRVQALIEEHGNDRVYLALQEANYSGDFEHEPSESMAALDAEFGEE